ncbi:carboxypeptidase regulatory-like domain-containing protein [Pseudobutyrivibrio ruminis]|uniref:carboxypeptidase regulatory-like domain-containing protein n=1 Tax=Pseudobutyrivibrio ruminis TaxID=46206 RepID=UPI00041AA7B7|nr:carboxypeptidase regulatory-like domain-containing protein [Pseudobutyrivibrio ruminis]
MKKILNSKPGKVIVTIIVILLLLLVGFFYVSGDRKSEVADSNVEMESEETVQTSDLEEDDSEEVEEESSEEATEEETDEEETTEEASNNTIKAAKKPATNTTVAPVVEAPVVTEEENIVVAANIPVAAPAAQQSAPAAPATQQTVVAQPTPTPTPEPTPTPTPEPTPTPTPVPTPTPTPEPTPTPVVVENGTLAGTVRLASDRTTPVENASVVIKNTDGETWNVVTDSEGRFNMVLPADQYSAEISAEGFEVNHVDNAVVRPNETLNLAVVYLIASEAEENGIASGNITDALTGRGVAGATLKVRRGSNNVESGDIVATATTADNGDYSVELPIGNYCMSIEKEGYISGSINIIVQQGTTANQNGSITPIVSENDEDELYRMVLTWGEDPRDLDSHLVGNLSNGETYHVYYSHKTQMDGEEEACKLDVDDTTSYGPETVTLDAELDSPYYYYVHLYAGDGTIATSGAKVEVYKGTTLVRTFNAPSVGEGRYWNVFALTDGQIIVKDVIEAEPDTEYATNGSATESEPTDTTDETESSETEESEPAETEATETTEATEAEAEETEESAETESEDTEAEAE